MSENHQIKIFCEFQIQAYRHFQHSIPEMTVIEQRNVWIIDIAIPGDARAEDRELGKLTQPRHPAIEITHLWMKHILVSPVVTGNNAV